MICKLFGHKWGGWKSPIKNIARWRRQCARCPAYQVAGSGKRPNYKGLKENK